MKYLPFYLAFAVATPMAFMAVPDDSLKSETVDFHTERGVIVKTPQRVRIVSSKFLLSRATHIKIVRHPAALTPGTPAYDAWVIEVCKANGITVTESNLKQGRFWNRRLNK